MANSIYKGRDGRLRIYIQQEKRLMSYPKYLMEQELGHSLMPNEEVHHKDENPLNNDLTNLEVRMHGEHQAEHATKYYDITAVCGWCGKEFLWTSTQQSHFYSNQRIRETTSNTPFCSRQCAGKHNRHFQMKYHENDTDLEYESPMRKLTNDQARYIRDNYVPRDSQYGRAALARRFGVSKRVVDAIISGETYRNI